MRPNNKTIVFYSIFTFLYIFPLLLVNNYYVDDMPRSLYGYGWNHDGRFLNTILMQILSFGSLSVDLFPYSNILAAMILALSGYFISKILNLEQNQQIQFSGLILLTGPLMLENLSYRWDSLPMSISVLSVIIPYLYKDNYKKFALASLIGLAICLLTYQAALAISGLLAICMAMSYCLQGKSLKDIFLILAIPSIVVIATYVFYKTSVSLFQLNLQNKNLTIFGEDNFFFLLRHNVYQTFLILKNAFNIPVSLIFLIGVIGALIAYVKFICTKKSIVYKLIPILLIFVIPIVIIFIQVIPQNNNFSPRILLGFSFFFYPLLVFINHYSERFCKYISIALVATALPLMAAYANSLKNQNTFEQYLLKRITQKVGSNGQNMMFDGTEPWAPELQIPVDNFPILKNLIPRYMNHSWLWGGDLVKKNYYQDYNLELFGKRYNELRKNKRSIPIIDKTPFYYLRANDSITFVDFRKDDD